ncbi:MAG TPA: cytochrome P450 [Rhizomicrobium sp.]|jgi:hypothetical protein|nr:cytochrome P450 [Rhizomicrobium sp.]
MSDGSSKRAIDNAIADVEVYSDKQRYHELFRQLRAEDPVRWTEPDKYRPFWTVAKHADIVEVQRQGDIFLSAPRTTLNTIEAEQKIRAATGRHQVQRTVVSMDGAEHMAMRNVAREWFLPRNINALEADIGRIAKATVDEMVAHDGACDFAQDIAVWYPLRVILKIFGLSGDVEAEKRLLRLSQEMNGSLDRETQRSGSQGDHMLQVVAEMFEYFRPIAEDRRRNPKSDLASVIANATLNGEPMSDLNVFSYYLTVTVAGHDTTSASTAGGLQALIESPGEMAKLRANPDVIRTAVDEMVRWVHPVKHFFRTASQDYELRGRKIKAGDSLLMCYPSACRDEDVFKEPFTFRADRSPNPHLAFGFGPHLCLGQYLAKLEMAALYRELLSRVGDIELDGEPVESKTLFMGGLRRLPIRYSLTHEPVLAHAS